MKKIVFYYLLFIFFYSCNYSKKAENRIQPATYKHDEHTLHAQFNIFHVSDSISELHFKIASQDLLYMRPDGINFYSNVLISFRLTTTYDSKDIVDSASVRITDANNQRINKFIYGKINVNAIKNHNYFLRISVSDLNRSNSISAVLEVEKNDDLNRQNFLIKTKVEDVPLFCNYTKTGEELLIQYKAKISVPLFVRYYNRDFPLAAPPFSDVEGDPFQYRADSVFIIQLNKDGIANYITSKKGFYHFQLDTSKREGITVFNFSNSFPEIKKAEEMVLPLRFITTRQEYNELSNSTNKKEKIEKFWMDCSGNQERAKELIRKFYNRMKDANLYFTSYLEGWKTDRGMIYLIFGSPNTIYRSANSEVWTYGEENNINSLQYTFTKVNNPFTDNDYLLERSGVYKQQWLNAVDLWRQGRAYIQD